MNQPFDHAAQITEADALRSYKDYNVAVARINFNGLAPAWSDLGCRGCWGIIRPNQPCIDNAHAAWHKECYDKVKEIGSKHTFES